MKNKINCVCDISCEIINSFSERFNVILKPLFLFLIFCFLFIANAAEKQHITLAKDSETNVPEQILSIEVLGIIESAPASFFAQHTNETEIIKHHESVKSLEPFSAGGYVVCLLHNNTSNWLGLSEDGSASEFFQYGKWRTYHRDNRGRASIAIHSFATIRPKGRLLYFSPISCEVARKCETRVAIEYFIVEDLICPVLGEGVHQNVRSGTRPASDIDFVAPEKLFFSYLAPSGRIRIPCVKGH